MYPNTPGYQATDTSLSAAKAIAPLCNSLQHLVLAFINDKGPVGATDDEIQNECGLNPNTARPRRRELQLKGHVIDSGQRRSTRTGRAAIVWSLK